ncbi:hypothetical protein QCA50_004231 [Cerrena zonata]|uniref:Secreted protein n=1 Tax=Cerrena zonata TaxID=2478898 RepID=A0AAW0GNE3_9APHY
MCFIASITFTASKLLLSPLIAFVTHRSALELHFGSQAFATLPIRFRPILVFYAVPHPQLSFKVLRQDAVPQVYR